MDDMARLKKQIKLLAIGLVALGLLCIDLLVNDIAGRNSTTAWPDARLGKLKVQEVQIVSPDGEPRMIMHARDNSPVLMLMDQTGEIRIMLSAKTDGGGALLFGGPEKANNLFLNTEGLQMGDISKASVSLVSPSGGGPRLVVRDENGYATTLGRTVLLERQSGAQDVTSAASIVGTSKDSTVSWPLLKPPVNPR